MIRRPGPASELLALACERLAEREDLRGEQALTDIAVQCRQPLRVMIAGDVSAGKSTLVNALLGQVLAEVGRAETTAYLTWYRHPTLEGDRLPSGRNRVVNVMFPLADRIILLDSPGLNTTSQAQSSTLDMLSGRDHDAGAAALVYLVSGELSGQAASVTSSWFQGSQKQAGRSAQGKRSRGPSPSKSQPRKQNGGSGPKESRFALSPSANTSRWRRAAGR
jgi:ABC-type phosphate/phosphonate transport system ATPase subunit